MHTILSLILLGKFDKIVEKGETDMSKICVWFHHNSFKVNPGNFHF